MIQHRQVASGRATLAVETSGSGHPIVFLHAAVCDSRMWRAQLPVIGAGNMAIAYDRRGFGRTVAETEDHSAVADLLAVIDRVAEGRPAVLVACSQGGRIAFDAALMHPDRIRALVLISPSVAGAPDAALSPDITALAAMQKKAEDAGDLDRVNAIKARLWLDGPLQPEGRVAGAARQLFLEMNGAILRALPAGANTDSVPAFQRLGEIVVPALVVCGDYDFPHIMQRCRHIAGTLPRASHYALANAAHLPSLERPAEIAGLIGAFLERLDDLR